MVTNKEHEESFMKIWDGFRKAFRDFVENIQKPPKNKPNYRSTLKKKQQRW